MNTSTDFFINIVSILFITAQVLTACENTQPKKFTPLSDSSILNNPERGFFQVEEIQTKQSGYSPISLDDLNSFRQKNLSLVFIQYYLKPFVSSDISSAVLNNIGKDLESVRQSGLKAIVRFAYSDTSSQDAKLSQLQRHVDQIKGIITNNIDVVTAIQAGLVGRWGEWYYSDSYITAKDGNSKPAGKEDPKKVIDKLLSSIPNRMIQLRTPSIKQNYCGTGNLPASNAFNMNIPCARLGLHNDCFLALDQDQGTFTGNSQRDWLQKEGQFVMVGGETCDPAGTVDCTSSLNQIAKQRFTYLNQDYHEQVIQKWKDGGCYKKIANKMGYRFELTNGQFPSQVKAGSSYCATVSLTNTGAAPTYHGRPVQVILRNKNTLFTAAVNTDIRNWAPGKTVDLDLSVAVPSNAATGTYDVILNLPDSSPGLEKRPEYRIVFSNEKVVESSTRYNILTQVKIS